jgi:gas vesicle protein
MEISLEQIELVKDRTGVSYKEAKDALEFTNGNVVDAIIYVEENINHDYEKASPSAVDSVVRTVKEAVRKGNVAKIRIYKGDDIILNVPVTVGAVATIVFPWGVVAAAIASAAAKCKVELVREDGSIVDVNEKTGKVVETVKDKTGVIVDELKTKGGTLYDSAKEKGGDILNQVKDKSGDFFESAKAKGSEIYSEAVKKGSEIYESAKDKVTEYLNKADDEAEKIMDISDIDFEEEDRVDGD